MLPSTTTDGTADIIPQINRPTQTPAIVGISAVSTHARQYVKVVAIYTAFLPKHSEYGGKTTPPSACPN